MEFPNYDAFNLMKIILPKQTVKTLMNDTLGLISSGVSLFAKDAFRSHCYTQSEPP